MVRVWVKAARTYKSAEGTAILVVFLHRPYLFAKTVFIMRISLPLILALPFAFSSPLARRNETATLAPPLPVVDEPVAGSWIVTLREDALLPTVLDRLSKIPGIRKKYTYDFPNFKGFVITGTSRPIRTLASIPFIKSIEQDAVTTTTTIVRQSKAPYGLARLSNRAANKTTYYCEFSHSLTEPSEHEQL